MTTIDCMKLAYVAGPYRDQRGPHYVNENIHKARTVAAELWRMGYAVICPHLNTAHMNGVVDDATFLQGTKKMLMRSDLVVVVPDWQASTGTHDEILTAIDKEIPVYYWPDCIKSLTL